MNPADIGGRFSALSYFGLVPAALLNIDLNQLLDSAEHEMQRCADPNSAAAELGYALGTAITMGRDKLMLVMSETLRPLSAWIEQLIAESLGKQGMGSVPVCAEPTIRPTDNLDDRFYVLVDSGSMEPAMQTLYQQLVDVGCPVMRRSVLDRHDLGREYFSWEFATAIAAAVLQLNPFDEPDVAVSKAMTRSVLDGMQVIDRPADDNSGAALTPCANHPLFARCGDAASYLHELLNSVRTGDYFALLAFLPATASLKHFLQANAHILAKHLGCAVSTGIGPRYLHSTGQLHKGGANNGVFLLLSSDTDDDIDIPGQHYTFGQLNRAQASADFKVLQTRNRRVLRMHLGVQVERNLESLTELINAELLTPIFHEGGPSTGNLLKI
ncbi:Glucose-6-phosphate isomerase [subsurface metagenome]